MGSQYFCARPLRCAPKLRSISICRSRGRICLKTDGQCWHRRFPAVVTVILRRTAHSRSLRRSVRTIRACTAKSLTLTATRSWQMPMPTCRCRVAENLFPHRCTTLCGSMALTECMPDICPGIRRRMAVFACRNSTRSHSSTRSASALRSGSLAGRPLVLTWDNGDRHSSEAALDLQTRASALRHRFRRLRFPGGAKM